MLNSANYTGGNEPTAFFAWHTYAACIIGRVQETFVRKPGKMVLLSLLITSLDFCKVST